MNAIIEHINSAGYAFVEFAAAMLIQSGLLILLLLLADFALRKRVRAVFRYWIWMLVLVKLLLPTSLSGPFSLGYWFGDEIASVDVSHSTSEAQPQAGEAPVPVLPHIIDLSKVRPPIYPPSVTPSPGDTDLAPAESIAPPAVPITWQGVVFLLWLAIAAVMLLLLGQRAIFVRGLVAQAKNANRPMLDTLDQCRKSMKIKRAVSLKVPPNATSPAVCGLWRPVILIPPNMPAALGSADLRVVLLHELAHVRRGDLWVNLIQTLLQILYFYNPLLWLANAVIRRAREQAVDEAVLVAMGEKASQYPQTLVSVAKLAFKRPTLSLRLIGVVESKSALTARIKRILGRPIPKSAKLGILGLALIVITAAILLPMAGEKVEIGEGPEREMTLTLGWSGEKVKIPAPVVLPEWGRKTKEYKRWEKIGDARTFATYDTEGYKYVAHALGFSTDSNGVRHETIPNVQRFRPDGTLEVDTTYSPDGRPLDWRLYDKQGRKKVYAANYPGAKDQKRGVVFYGPDGKEAKEWQVSEFDVVYAELVSDPNGRSYFSHYEKELIHSPYPETFVARLPNGVTVELIGLCGHPSEGKQWWKPDGDELLEAPYDEIGGNVYPDGDEKSFEFAIRLKSLPAEHVNTKVRCEESVGGSAGGGSSPEKTGEYLSDFRWLATTFPKKLKACTVKVGVAAGQWQPVAASNGRGFGSRGSELGGVSFTKAFEVEDGISITVADDILGRPCRVVAITNDGEVVKPVRSSGSSAGKARQTTAKFNNISLSDIKEFQFQTRPYEWVEFKNVSLRPGVQTNVQVEVEGSPDGGSDEEDRAPKLITSAYEKGRASKDLKIKVGPTTFEVNTVVRWERNGNPIFEDGRGKPPGDLGFETPDYSTRALWMDTANIYMSPEAARYDVLELRVFDHQTREMLSPKGRIGIGYDVQDSVVQLRSIGAPLPDSVDVWFRLLHNPAEDSVWKLNAKAGASVRLDRETFSVRVIKPGSWSHTTKTTPGAPSQIQWTPHQQDGTTTVAFDFSSVKRSILSGPARYQICAVTDNGKRYVPDFRPFIGTVSGLTRVINFQVPAEKLSRFEIRRLHGRDRFYFDNVKLPGIPRRTFDPPPPVTVPVNGKKTEYTSTGLDPISLNVRVLPGIATASVQGGSGTRPARVYPASEPHGNPDTQTTAIYDFHGIELNRCFLTYLDDQGAPVTSRSTSRIAHGAPARQFAGYERVEIPIEKIAQARLSLHRLSQAPQRNVQVEGEGKGLADNSKVIEQAIQGSYEVSGTVFDPVPDSWWDDLFTKLEAVESEGEGRQILENVENLPDHPAAGVVVTLRGDSLTKETVTDAEGKFKFSGLPEGAYSLSCEKTVVSTRTGQKRLAVAKGDAQFNSRFPISSHKADLRLRDDYVTVKGRITDAQGRPVAGAKVTAILVVNNVAYQQYLANHDPPTWFAVSKNDGSYELQGIDPANFYHLAGYLQGGKALREYVEIHVEANGFVQDKNNIPKVPLVSEDVLYQARRLLKIFSQMSQRAGGPEYQEMDRLTFPSGSGNTITGIDIVLEQAGTAVQVEVEPGKLSAVTDLPNNPEEAQGNADEAKYEGRTIAEWIAQWDSKLYDETRAATEALIKIGRPAVPMMVEEVKKRTNHGWHAVGVLTKMGSEAEDVVELLIEAALDKDLRFGDGRQSTTAYRGSVLYSLSRMTWARDRVIPVLQRIAEDGEEEAGVRRQVILALRDIGKQAMPILQKLTEVEEHSVRDAAHGALGQLLEKEEDLSKDDYYTPLIEQDPFGPSVLQYLGNAKGIVNYGRPHPLTQRIKQLYRKRLAEEPDAELAWRLATIIQNGLRNTDLEWAAPTGGGRGQWNREDPAESYATLAEVLELGFRHAQADSELWNKFGIALAKLRLLQGDWDGMNAMLKELGQEQIPKESRRWLPAPPVDWAEDLRSQWKIADESMRSGNCSLEFKIEKAGKGLKGVHFLVKRAPEPTNVFSTGIRTDTLFFAPAPMKVAFGSFGYGGKDRSLTRYAVSDESGIVRFDKLPDIPVKIEVLVPTSNFPEAVSNWDLWMEVEPGKFKLAKIYGGAEAVDWRYPPAVVELKQGQTIHYPKLVVRSAFGLNVRDWARVDKDNFVLSWARMDSATQAKTGRCELEMSLSAPPDHPYEATHAPVLQSAKIIVEGNRWPVGEKGVGDLHLEPGNIYMFGVRALDASGVVIARWPRIRVWTPWGHRTTDPPFASVPLFVRGDLSNRPPIHNRVWHYGSFDKGTRRRDGLREGVGRFLSDSPNTFEYEYVRMGKAWLDWHDDRQDARRQLEKLVKELPEGNVARGTAVWLIEQIDDNNEPPKRLNFVPDRESSRSKTPPPSM